MKAYATEELPTDDTSPPSQPPPSRPRSSRHAELPDAEALLVALTLSPATYSRNRFYEMYTAPEMQRTRRRAGQLRGVVTALASEAPARVAGQLLAIDTGEDGGAVLTYEVPSIGMRRTLRLRAIVCSCAIASAAPEASALPRRCNPGATTARASALRCSACCPSRPRRQCRQPKAEARANRAGRARASPSLRGRPDFRRCKRALAR